MLYYLIYVSSACFDFTDQDLLDLLEQSREDNLKLEITGMLLYKGGNFMQVLEGERDAVKGIFEKIRVDKRHKGVIVVLEGDLAERQFPNWSMGFKRMSDQVQKDEVGYTDFLDYSSNLCELQAHPSVCHRLLLSFRDNLR